MGFKENFDFKIGFLFLGILVVFAILMFVGIYFNLENKSQVNVPDWSEAIWQILIFGFLVFFIGGILGKRFWEHRWFKIIFFSVLLVIFVNLFSRYFFQMLPYSIRNNLFVFEIGMVIFQINLMVLFFDKSFSFSTRYFSIGVFIPLLILFVLGFFFGGGDGYGWLPLFLYGFPLGIVGGIIGLISGMRKDKARLKGNLISST